MVLMWQTFQIVWQQAHNCGARAQETKAMLLDAGILPDSCSAARAIGYRQALGQLQAWRDDPVSITADSVVCSANLVQTSSLSAPTSDHFLVATEERGRTQVELVRAIQIASRQYCHRQLTWARGLPLFSWVDADQGQEAVMEQILSELQSAAHTGDQHNFTWFWLPCMATRCGAA